MERVTVCESAPLVPVIVIRVGARLCESPLVVSVRIEVEVAGFGEKENDIPRGGEPTESVTGLEKPPLVVIETVNVVEPVPGTVAEAGVTLSEKSPGAGGCTTRLAATECVSAPFVTVMVNGYVAAARSEVVVNVRVDVEPAAGDVGFKMMQTPP